MILHCTFEELTAVTTGIERVLRATGQGGVAAPPQVISDIEALAPRLGGDLTVLTLREARSIESAVAYLLEQAHEHIDAYVLEQHAAAEAAVQAYFEYAHLLTLLDRIRRISSEMAALIELMTGASPTERTSREISFAD
jgi:hypothetical protein